MAKFKILISSHSHLDFSLRQRSCDLGPKVYSSGLNTQTEAHSVVHFKIQLTDLDNRYLGSSSFEVSCPDKH